MYEEQISIQSVFGDLLDMLYLSSIVSIFIYLPIKNMHTNIQSLSITHNYKNILHN